jgi:hypothetical protein
MVKLDFDPVLSPGVAPRKELAVRNVAVLCRRPENLYRGGWLVKRTEALLGSNRGRNSQPDGASMDDTRPRRTRDKPAGATLLLAVAHDGFGFDRVCPANTPSPTACRGPQPAQLIGRYAQRRLMENKIEVGIDFFHPDALSGDVALKGKCNHLLTLIASTLHLLQAGR